MSRSNIICNDEALATFQSLKERKYKNDDGKKCKFLVFQIKDKKEIAVVGEGFDTGDSSQNWENFLEALDVGCSYGVFDYETKMDGRIIEKIILVKYVPDNFSPLKKFPYGSSFEGLKAQIQPHIALQASSLDELHEEDVIKMISVEESRVDT